MLTRRIISFFLYSLTLVNVTAKTTKTTTTTITTASSTATSTCYPTAITPPPSGLQCGTVGKFKHLKKSLLRKAVKFASLDICAGYCANAVGCDAFGYNSKSRACQILGNTLTADSVKVQASGPAYYDIGCFTQCNATDPSNPPPATGPGATTNQTTPVYNATAIPYNTGATRQNISAESTKQFIYGTVDANSTVFYAITDFTAPDGSALVSLESFLPFVSNVTCAADSITITFQDAAAYTVATSWPGHFFLVTTGPAYCGNGTERTFYSVTAPTLDSNSNTATLPVQAVTAQQAINGVSVNFGTVPASDSSSTRKRDTFSSIIAFIEFWYSGFTLSGSYNFDIKPDTFGFAGFLSGTYGNLGGPLEISCEYQDACGVYTTGTVSGSFGCTGTTCGNANVAVSFNNIDVVSVFRISTGSSLSLDEQIPVASVSLFSFNCLGVVDIEIGAELVFDVYFESDGSLEFGGIGGNTSFPGGASASLDAIHRTGSLTIPRPSFSAATPGFNGQFPSNVTFGVWTGPQITFTINVPVLPAIPDISATVYAETPRLELDLNRVNPGTANCGTPKTAVAVLLDLDLFVELHAGASGPGIKNAYNDVTLYQYEQDLITNKCLTLG